MTTVERFTSRAVVSIAMLLAACGGYKSPTAPPSTTDTVTASIAGNWIVSSLVQGKDDETSQFSGYTLKFAETGDQSGTVTATRDNSTVSGTWSHSSAVTYYGSSSSESMVLNLGTSAPFARITGTWNVSSSTNTQMSLSSPELAEGMQLVLTRE